jgi:hypothetical protein
LAALHLASATNSNKSIDHGIVVEWLNVFARRGRKQELVVGLLFQKIQVGAVLSTMLENGAIDEVASVCQGNNQIQILFRRKNCEVLMKPLFEVDKRSSLLCLQTLSRAD